MDSIGIYEKRNIQNSYNKELKDLHLKNQNKIDQKNNELKSMKKVYDKKEQQIKFDGNEKTRRAEEQQKIKDQKARENHEQKLKSYDDRLKKHKGILERELNNLKTDVKKRRHNIIKEDEKKRTGLHQKNQDGQSRQELESSLELKEQNNIHLNMRKKRRLQHLADLKKLTRANDEHLDRAYSKSKVQTNYQTKTLREQKRSQKLHNISEMNLLKLENKRLKKIESAKHQDEINKMNDHFLYTYKRREKIQDTRYKELDKKYNTLLKNLKNSKDQEIKSIVKKHSSFKNHLTEKIADRFYQVNLINPQIKDLGDHYIVSIKIPEHEKENVLITTNKRQIRITMARRFSGEITDDQNEKSRNIAKRSEVLTKLFHTKDILAQDKITQSYAKGELSFKIKKA